MLCHSSLAEFSLLKFCPFSQTFLFSFPITDPHALLSAGGSTFQAFPWGGKLWNCTIKCARYTFPVSFLTFRVATICHLQRISKHQSQNTMGYCILVVKLAGLPVGIYSSFFWPLTQRFRGHLRMSRQQQSALQALIILFLISLPLWGA